MLHASETWPLTKTNLQRNDRAMITQICSIKPEDVATERSSELLRWFWHVERSSGAVRTACDIQIEGRWGGREERDPPMWMMPLHLYVKQKPDYDDDIILMDFPIHIDTS